MRPVWVLLGLALVVGAAGAKPLHGRAGPYHLEVTASPDPPLLGPVNLTVVVTGPAGPAEVEVGLKLRERGGEEAFEPPVRPLGDGHYTADLELRRAAAYDLLVTVEQATARFRLVTGNPLHQPDPAAVRGFWWRVALLLSLPGLLGLVGGRLGQRRVSSRLAGAVFVVLAFLVARQAVVAFRRPGAMDVIEAQAMDMTVMRPPVGVVPVQLETVEASDFQASIKATGSVVPWREQVVRARVTGRIVDLPVYPGDAVVKGQLLAQLDTRELTGREEEAILAHLAAQDAVGAAGAEARRAQAEVEEARAMSRAADHRVVQATSDRAAAEAAASRAASQVATAEAMVREADSRLAASRAGRRTAAAMSDEGRAAVKFAEAGRETAGQAVAEAEQLRLVAEREVAAAGQEVAAAMAEQEAATAQLTAAQAELPQARAEVDAAQARVTYWQAELKRMTALLADGAVAQEEFDRERSEADQAAAGLATAKAGVEKVNGAIQAARAAVRKSEAALAAARERQAATAAGLKAAEARLAQARSRTIAEQAEIGRQQAGLTSRTAAEDEADSMIAMRVAELDRSRAELATARAGVEEATSQVARAKAAVEEARAEQERARRAIQTALRAAEAATGRVREATSMAAARRAAAFTAGTIKDYTRLTAELAGVVTERTTSPTTLVQPGEVIVKVAEIDRVRLQAPVALADAAAIHRGAPVTVGTQKDPTRRDTARVSAIFPATDPTSRTVLVEAELANPDRFYLPGDFITLELATGAGGERVTVPTSAIVHLTAEPGAINGETRPAVWTVVGGGEGRTEYYCTMHPEVVSDEPGLCPKCKMELTPRQVGGGGGQTEYYCTMHPEVVSDEPGLCPKCKMELVPRTTGGAGVAHRVPVTLGRRSRDRVEVLSGLKPGDRVIRAGHTYLREGDRVAPVGELPAAPVIGAGGHAGH